MSGAKIAVNAAAVPRTIAMSPAEAAPFISPRDALSSTLQSLWMDSGSYRTDF